MTKDDAINLLRANVMVACDTSDKVGYGTPLNRAIEQALDMAIKALAQEETTEDTDFVPVEIEFMDKKGYGYLYKPQQLIVTGYFTLEAFKYFGGKYKEKGKGEND